MKTFIILLLLAAISTPALASRAVSETPEVATLTSAQAHFFVGQIQRSSLDGNQMYGPAFESVVRRVVDLDEGKILECVFQEGKVFVSELIRTGDPLTYWLNDLGGFSTGELSMETEAAEAWSYDIDVLEPVTGKITGSLADGNGARIFPDGRMEIKKIWNNQMLISESYNAVSESEYLEMLPTLTPSAEADVVAQMCK